ncbi:MAG TPA: alcohol dehydrogenase catalytic domain-containing protein [Ktedonobacteraceae bacterium]|nr:alcohol dehydrogenase catalytic domain-containing protein [Ktedonobacteraceae bacterium]
MWTSMVDLDPMRVLLTRLLGSVWHDAYFSSFAPLSVQNVPRQALPAANWVRVRNRLAGICGSDLHLIHADGDLRIAPAALPGHRRTYLGHEVIGEVIEIGENVQKLAIGDRVVLQYGLHCLSAGVQPPCRSCVAGNYNLCEHGRLPGPEPIGGGWSEEMLLHEEQLYRVAPTITDEQAVLIEPAAVALHAILRCPPRPGDHVLIIGAGTIGLLTLQVLKALAPQVEISVLARHSFQVEQATRMGAKHIIYPQDSYASVRQATGAQLFKGIPGNRLLLGGFDIIYDTVGHRKTLHHALRWTRSQGTIVLVGLDLHLMKIDLTPIWYREINLIGTLSHGTEHWPSGSNTQRSTFSIIEELMENGEIRPEQLITHHFALDKYQQALTIAASKAQSRAIKVVFDYSLQPASVVPNVRASARRRPSLSPPVIDQLPLEEIVHTPQEPLLVDLPTPPLPIPTPVDDITDEATIDEEDTAQAIPALEPQSDLAETTTEKMSSVTVAEITPDELDEPTHPAIAIPEATGGDTASDRTGTEPLSEIAAAESQQPGPKTSRSASSSSNSRTRTKNTVTKSSSETLSHSEKSSTARVQQRTQARKKK